MNNSVKSLVIFAAAVVVAWPAAVLAHETDQLSNRADPIADSTQVLNREVNKALVDVVEKSRKDDDRMAVVNAIFGKLGSRFLVDRIEKWAIKSPEVEKSSVRTSSGISCRKAASTIVASFALIPRSERPYSQPTQSGQSSDRCRTGIIRMPTWSPIMRAIGFSAACSRTTSYPENRPSCAGKTAGG